MESSPERCSSTNGIVVGYGLGQLSAAAVACSDNVLELVTVATEAVRLAFRVGAVVRKCSAPLQSFRTSDQPWTAVIDEDLHQVTERLETLQNELVCRSIHLRQPLIKKFAECPEVSTTVSDVCRPSQLQAGRTPCKASPACNIICVPHQCQISGILFARLVACWSYLWPGSCLRGGRVKSGRVG